jgi:hypothetical protein
MKVDLIITANNITYQAGDSLLITFDQPFRYVSNIDSISFDFVPLNTSVDGHDIYLRWSYDTIPIDRATGKPNIVYSAWESYSINGTINPDIQSIYAKIIERDSFDLQIRLVRRGPNTGARRIDRVVLNMTTHPPPEVPSESPFGQETCNARACSTINFGSGIRLDCDKNLLFRPYDVMAPGIQLYRDLSCAVSEMFGHCVRYFKTQAIIESADPILKEYSLFEVTDVKDIKIMVPDNAFPDNAMRFISFDMDFGDGLEVHIVKEHFERAFGQDDLPEQKDYLYFPLLDRMFEVHSAYLFRDFMMSESYYKVMLYKWQDKVNVMRPPEIDAYVDELTENFDEILQPEIDREFQEITKPLQYKTISIGGFDHVRSLINDKLIIETSDLTNYFTVVGKYFYDMSKGMSHGDLAVKYKLAVDRKIEENTAFSMWFKTKKVNFNPQVNTVDNLLYGFNLSENKGYKINLRYSPGVTANSAITSSLDLVVNSSTYTFNGIPQLQPEKWYGLVVNHMNEFSQAAIYIWEMKYNPNQPTQNKTTDLRLIYTQVQSIVPDAVNPTDTTFQLLAGTYASTNIRIWKESIEEEKQALLLNQFVVRDSDQTLLIDGAIAPLRMVREYVR